VFSVTIQAVKARPGTYLFSRPQVPRKAKFPVIDAHNHLWGAWNNIKAVVKVMDETGVACYCDLTANVELQWVKGGYAFKATDIDGFLEHAASPYPGRFYGFTTTLFTRPTNRPLFTDAKAFVAEVVRTLDKHVRSGLRGLKILKELGLHYRDAAGRLLRCCDDRLAPVWEECARRGLPVLLHQADPYGFFEPVTPANEHYGNLKKYSSWSFVNPKFPRFMELQRDMARLVRNHRRATFILAHVANFPENLEYVSDLLDANPNVFVDLSARTDELGRQPHTAREFIIRHQDRVLFGTDMPASPEMYRYHFRFYETFDEYFPHPDYDGTFDRHRWKVCGIGLPDEVLKKLYHLNALKLIPGLRTELKGLRI